MRGQGAAIWFHLSVCLWTQVMLVHAVLQAVELCYLQCTLNQLLEYVAGEGGGARVWVTPV